MYYVHLGKKKTGLKSLTTLLEEIGWTEDDMKRLKLVSIKPPPMSVAVT